MTRRRSALAAIVAAVLVALVAVGTFALGRLTDPTPTIALGPPKFVDVTASSGVDHVYDGDYPFAVGGGVAVLDCNGDGKPDLFLAGGVNPAALYRNDSPVGGDLQFTRIPGATTDLVDVLGAYPIDFDGDGITDLVVLRRGQSVLLRGLGNCRFDAGTPFGGANDWTNAFSATWEATSNMPTLAFGQYLTLGPDGQPDPSYTCADNLLYRPNPILAEANPSGEGHSTEGGPSATGVPSAEETALGTRYPPPLTLRPGYCSLSMLFSDWDRSGRRDLRVTNDRQYYVGGQDQLWRMDPGTPPRLYTDRDGWVALQIWGMGIATFDLNGKGYPDVFLTSQGDNKLQTLTVGPGQPTYRDMALRKGVTAAQPFTGGDVRPSTAWHPEFEDVNNDGFVDLFVSKGNVSSQPDYASRDPSDLFIGQPDGSFRESADAAGIVAFDRGRGAALADFAMDGQLDLVELNYGQPVRVWRNVGVPGGPAGHWLGIRLQQPGGNHDAVGAWIEVQVGKTIQRRELQIGGGHAGGQLGWTHFGLGPATDVQVRVQWPDGELGPWLQVRTNQFVVLDRATGQLQPWQP